jgi:hypothetical protein
MLTPVELMDGAKTRGPFNGPRSFGRVDVQVQMTPRRTRPEALHPQVRMALGRQQGGELIVPTARFGQAGAGDPAPELHPDVELVSREIKEHRHPANKHTPSLM